MITFADDPPAPAPPPAAITPDDPAPLPGTPARLRILCKRADRRESLHQKGDVISTPGQVVRRTRSRNGQDKPERPVVVVPLAKEGEKVSVLTDRNRGKQTCLALCRNAQLAGLGARLRSLRGKRSLGQVALAARVGRTTLHDLETGRNLTPSLSVLWALADAYRLSLDELVGRVIR